MTNHIRVTRLLLYWGYSVPPPSARGLTRQLPTPMSTSWSGKHAGFPPSTRRAILAHQPDCATGCGQPSQIADHIINYPTALRLGWTLEQYHSPHNGQALCDPCHTTKTRAEQAEGRKHKQAKLRKPPRKHPGEL